MKSIHVTLVILLTATFAVNAQTEKAPESKTSEIYFTNTVKGNMEKVHQKVVDALKAEKFGVITEVDMAGTLKEKLGVDIMPYKILGVCNPGSAYEALQAEPNIGVFLPCKVILKQVDENTIEVVAANPEMMMEMLNNDKLNNTAREVSEKLQKVISGL